MWMIVASGFGGDHPGVMPVHFLVSGKLKIKRTQNLVAQLLPLLPVLLFDFPQTPVFRFALALVHFLVEAFLFLFLAVRVERFIVLRDAAVERCAVQNHGLIGAGFFRGEMTLAVAFEFLHTMAEGVVVYSLPVHLVVLGRLSDNVGHVLGGNG